ncbi:MAG: DNA adenine methylase [Desulfarculus sp.]|nr:DNA adenine methylase [Desulfarculus sp.]
MEENRLRPPFKWFGGKQGLAGKFLELLPPHRVYVEVFGGSGALLLAKQPAPLEVYNDLDSGLVGLFRVLRDPDQAARLLLLASQTPYSREEYQHCRDTWEDCADPVERAYRWLVVAGMSFGGLFGRSWGSVTGSSSRGIATTSSSWLSYMGRLGRVHERIMTVQVEHQDFRRLIPRYDSPETLYYLDPPYVAETRRAGGYRHEMTLEDHQELVELLLGIEGMALLSGYEHAAYRPLERAGWQVRRWDVVCHAAGRTKASGLKGRGAVLAKQRRVECAWISPRAVEARRRKV